MNYLPNNIYHVYNRGNNRQQIFFNRNNYLYFLKQSRKFLSPHADFLAYNLIPNQFHFLIHADERTAILKIISGGERNVFSEGIRMLLSSYSQAINKQEKRTGSLFTQNTKSKWLTEEDNSEDHPLMTFHSIHQKVLRAGLVKRLEDWEFSSFRDYAGLRKGSFCNSKLAVELLNLNMKNFVKESSAVMIPDVYEKTW